MFSCLYAASVRQPPTMHSVKSSTSTIAVKKLASGPNTPKFGLKARRSITTPFLNSLKLRMPRKSDVFEDLQTMSDGSILSPQYGRSRTFRSHSLMPSSLPSVIAQRTKRTHSLPACKHVLPPLIHIDRLKDLCDEDSETDCAAYCENVGWYTPIVGLSCSVFVYLCSCALAIYSKG